MPDITGTSAPETLDGTTGDDRMFGLDGDDTLNGLAGDDYLQGDAGNDTLNGGEDDDTYLVDSGDIVNESVGQGFDIVYALTSYVLAAAASVERLSSTNHLETVAKDLVGNDTVIDIFGNNGANVLTGGAANNYMLGFGGTDTLHGLGGADLLFGMDGTDTLNGGAGNDYLDGGAGNDVLSGGADDDFYLVGTGDTVNEADGEGFDVVYALSTFVLAASARVELLSSTDHLDTTAKDLTGNDFVPTLYGNNGVNNITGGASANLILGFGGNDTLNGLTGADALFGMDGNDTLNGGSENDFLDGGTGTNTLAGGTGNDVFIVRGTDTIVELDGEGIDAVYVTTASYTLSANARVELLSSANTDGTEARNLTANNWVSDIYGNNGVNTLTGNALNNTMLGLAGNDIIRGNGGNDFIDGGAGADDMNGGDGDDTYFVDTIGDTLSESSSTGGNDIVHTSVDLRVGQFNHVETIAASDAAATTALRLFGTSSANQIMGNAGANLLDTGFGGNDSLTGFGGADIFNLRNADASGTGSGRATVTGVVTITDFEAGVDKIRLDTTKFRDLLGKDSSMFEIGATATSAGTRLLYDPATGNLIWDTDGNQNSAPLADPGAVFAHLQPGLAFTFSDFIIEANRAPEANADAFSILFTGVNQSISIGPTGNDFDIDGFDPWMTRIALQGGPWQDVANGLSTKSFGGIYGNLVGQSNGYSYTLNASDPDTMALAPGQTVTEVYIYEITDGKADRLATVSGFAQFSQSTITITITKAADGSMSSTVLMSDAKDDQAPSLAAPASEGPAAFATVDHSAFGPPDTGEALMGAHMLRESLDSLAPDLWIG